MPWGGGAMLAWARGGHILKLLPTSQEINVIWCFYSVQSAFICRIMESSKQFSEIYVLVLGEKWGSEMLFVGFTAGWARTEASAFDSGILGLFFLLHYSIIFFLETHVTPQLQEEEDVCCGRLLSIFFDTYNLFPTQPIMYNLWTIPCILQLLTSGLPTTF